MKKLVISACCIFLLCACTVAKSRKEADEMGRDGYINCIKDAYGRDICREIRIDRKTGEESVYMEQSYY